MKMNTKSLALLVNTLEWSYKFWFEFPNVQIAYNLVNFQSQLTYTRWICVNSDKFVQKWYDIFFKFPDIFSNYSIQNKISEQDENMLIALLSCWSDF